MHNILVRLSDWRAKRKHAREWPLDMQVERARSIVADDNQWLCHNPIADALCRRHLALLAPDWEKQPIERIDYLRSRLGLDPYRKPAVANGWTPTKERLPTEKAQYLGAFEDGQVELTSFDPLTKRFWYGYPDYWMPVPAAPAKL